MKKLYKDQALGKSFFYYYGAFIALLLVLFYVLYFSIFRAIYYVPRTKKLNFFIASYGVKDYSIKKKLHSYLKDDGLLEVNFYDYLVSDARIVDYYSAYSKSCDFFIFDETTLTDMKELVATTFMDLSNVSNDIPEMSEYETFKYEGVDIGLKIFDKDDETYNNKYKYTSWIDFTYLDNTDNYYLLIYKKSPNFNKETHHTLGYLGLEYFLYENKAWWPSLK